MRAARMISSYDDLYDALRKDDLETFRSQLLTYGWPKNSQYSDHHLLSEAIKFGRKEVANFLLDLKCRVSKPGSLNTLVHIALKYPDWSELVVKLVDLGSLVSTVNAAGDTAVHIAFKEKANVELIDLLLKAYVRECIVNIKDSEGLSILHIACSRSNVEIVQALTHLDSRVIVTRDDVNGQVQSKHDTGYSRYTPLHFAVKNSQTAIVKFLLKHLNIDIYKVETHSSTPLHLALELNNIEILDCILAYDKTHGDNVNNIGITHFMAACAGSDTSIVAEYLRLTQHRPWTSASSLISNKVADSADSPYRGFSAMHFAAAFNRLDTVQLLLDHGASCFVVSAENFTPLVVAVKRGHEDVCRLLCRSYKAYRQSIYDAIAKKNRKRAMCGQNGLFNEKSQVVSSLNSVKEKPLELKSPKLPPPGFESLKNPRLSPVVHDQESPRLSLPPTCNGLKISTSPRRGLVEKQVGSKLPGFHSKF